VFALNVIRRAFAVHCRAVVLAAEITAFHIAGGLLALWAVVLAVLGLTRHDFPGKGAGQTIVMAISGVLMLAAVGTAIVTAKDEPKSEEQAGFENKVGKEGTGAPDSGGAQAAGGTGSGQSPGENGENVPAGGTITKLTLNADETQLAFDKTSLEAPKGNVRITMTNPSASDHNVALEGPGGIDEKGPIVGKGGASEVEAKVDPGSYTFYCSVPGHRQAGMEGQLTVK
jgi:uncharacterized cupredoxin-like copper-binding protein